MGMGTVVSVVKEKGFGFIQPEAGGDDLFFHMSTVQGVFEDVNVGQKVKYEVDEESQKPRARRVIMTGEVVPVPPSRHAKPSDRTSNKFGGRDKRSAEKSGNDRRDGRRDQRSNGSEGSRSGSYPKRDNRGGSERDARRPTNRADGSGDTPELRRNYEFGFVTKISKEDEEGALSADSGGPELLFVASSVLGKKNFFQLRIGDYVRFLRGPKQVKPPVATLVQVSDRQIKTTEPFLELPSHPKARGRKPTWK